MRRVNEFSAQDWQHLKNLIHEKSGFHFGSSYLLPQAFTRSSYSAQWGGENNEILEFIGDQVLSYYVVKLAAERFGAQTGDCQFAFRARENRFHQLKQELVGNESLAAIIDDWAVAEYLIVGESDYKNQVDRQTKVKADLLEAILGAIAVACKWDAAVLEKAVSRMLRIDEKMDAIMESDWRPVRFDLDNAVTVLKELAEHGQCSVPEYHLTDLGHDKDGSPVWSCRCSILNDKTAITRSVFGPSKKTVKKCAAYLVLCEHFERQNEYGINGWTGGNYIFWYKDGKLMPENYVGKC